MKRILLLVGCMGLTSLAQARGSEVSVVKQPATGATNAFTVSNRPPLEPQPLIKLPGGALEPSGWLGKQLRLQADGCCGHLGEISAFLEKEGNAWLDPSGAGTHGWEEPPYWLKGYIALAYLLEDERMIAEANVWIEGALASQQPDGWFGPDKGRRGAATRLEGRQDLWPNMIMLFCLQTYHDHTGDERVIELMTRYFRYLDGVPEAEFLVGYWPKMRGGDLLFSVYWLYNRTGDAWLLELAGKVHRCTADWTSDVIDWHNVNMAQGFGQPTTYWLQSHDPAHLLASYRNYDRIRDLYGQVPGGMFGGDENCRVGYTDPRQAVETCGMVEMMLSTETLLSFTGDVVWADRCEDVAFNSLPAALDPELRALRYLTAPNLVLSDGKPKNPGLQNGGPMLLLSPHRHRCCQHNWGHGWPYFAEHLWFATPDNGLAAVLYSAGSVRAKVGGGGVVLIEERTRYPFDGQILFLVRPARDERFSLYLRVPGWCRGATLAINDETVAVAAPPGSFFRIERTWTAGDRVRLSLPMAITLRRWEKNQDSVSVDRGPLTYSLKIGEEWRREGGTDEWPAWEIRPTTPWNYGLVLDEEDSAASFTVVEKAWPDSDMPFTLDGTPLELRARAKRIPEWRLDGLGLVGTLQASPVKSDEPTEVVALVPMGAARLRISSFPVIGTGPDAHAWVAPPEPAYRARASHCFDGDSVLAVLDGIVPSSSSDGTVPRHTWWDHLGTAEWLDAEFDQPRQVSAVEVYWFDDRGGCRVPWAWRLLYRAGDRWLPVENPTGFDLELDRFNRTSFDPVSTGALRLEAWLQPGRSGGVVEWRIE